jgi:hypothetical protein
MLGNESLQLAYHIGTDRGQARIEDGGSRNEDRGWKNLVSSLNQLDVSLSY